MKASTVDGTNIAAVARKAVIVATGGFTHDVELRQNHLSAARFFRDFALRVRAPLSATREPGAASPDIAGLAGSLVRYAGGTAGIACLIRAGAPAAPAVIVD